MSKNHSDCAAQAGSLRVLRWRWWESGAPRWAAGASAVDWLAPIRPSERLRGAWHRGGACNTPAAASQASGRLGNSRGAGVRVQSASRQADVQTETPCERLWLDAADLRAV